MNKKIRIRHLKELTEEEKEYQSSCRFCNVGVGVYKCESEEGTFWVCEKHKDYILKEYKRE